MATERYRRIKNERRRAKTRIKRLEKKLTQVKSQTAVARIKRDIKNIQDAVDATYTYSPTTGKKIRDVQEVSANIENMTRVNNQYSSVVQSNRKSNLATQIEINKASVGESAEYTEDQVHIFYRATQKAWENVPIERRNQAILDYYGYDNLAEAFEEVTSNQKNKDIQRALNIVQNPDEYTDDDRKWAYDVIKDNEDDFQLSPSRASGGATPDVSPVAPM